MDTNSCIIENGIWKNTNEIIKKLFTNPQEARIYEGATIPVDERVQQPVSWDNKKFAAVIDTKYLPLFEEQLQDILTADARLPYWILFAREYYKRGRQKEVEALFDSLDTSEAIEYFIDKQHDTLGMRKITDQKTIQKLENAWLCGKNIDNKNKDNKIVQRKIILQECIETLGKSLADIHELFNINNNSSNIQNGEPPTITKEEYIRELMAMRIMYTLLSSDTIDTNEQKIILKQNTQNNLQSPRIDAFTLLVFGLAKYTLGEYKECIQMLSRALIINPLLPVYVRTAIGICYFVLHSYTRAYQAFLRALQLSQDDPIALIGVSMTQLQLQLLNIRKIEPYILPCLLRAYDLNPTNPTVLLSIVNYSFFLQYIYKKSFITYDTQHSMLQAILLSSNEIRQGNSDLRSEANYELGRLAHINNDYELSWKYYNISFNEKKNHNLSKFGKIQIQVYYGEIYQALQLIEEMILTERQKSNINNNDDILLTYPMFTNQLFQRLYSYLLAKVNRQNEASINLEKYIQKKIPLFTTLIKDIQKNKYDSILYNTNCIDGYKLKDIYIDILCEYGCYISTISPQKAQCAFCLILTSGIYDTNNLPRWFYIYMGVTAHRVYKISLARECYVRSLKYDNAVDVSDNNSTVDENGTNIIINENTVSSTSDNNNTVDMNDDNTSSVGSSDTNTTVDVNGTNTTVDVNGTNTSIDINNNTVDANDINNTVDANDINNTVDANDINNAVDVHDTNSTVDEAKNEKTTNNSCINKIFRLPIQNSIYNEDDRLKQYTNIPFTKELFTNVNNITPQYNQGLLIEQQSTYGQQHKENEIILEDFQKKVVYKTNELVLEYNTKDEYTICLEIALKIYKNIIQNYPKYNAARLRQIVLLYKLKRTDELLMKIKEVVAINDDDDNDTDNIKLEWTNEEKIDILCVLANLVNTDSIFAQKYSLRGDKLLEKASHIDPKNIYVIEARAKQLIDRAIRCKNKYISQIEQNTFAQNTNSINYKERAKAAEQNKISCLGCLAEACNRYKRVIELDNKNSNALCGLQLCIIEITNIHRQSIDTKKILSNIKLPLQYLSKLQPENLSIHLNLANYYMLLQSYTEAILQYRYCASICTNRIDLCRIYNYLACVLHIKKQSKESIILLQRALDMEPNGYNTMYNLAIVLEETCSIRLQEYIKNTVTLNKKHLQEIFVDLNRVKDIFSTLMNIGIKNQNQQDSTNISRSNDPQLHVLSLKSRKHYEVCIEMEKRMKTILTSIEKRSKLEDTMLAQIYQEQKEIDRQRQQKIYEEEKKNKLELEQSQQRAIELQKRIFHDQERRQQDNSNNELNPTKRRRNSKQKQDLDDFVVSDDISIMNNNNNIEDG